MPEPHVACIAAQVLAGLAFLHSHDVLHRDVKPGNVLHNERGDVKLTDFGISKELTATLLADTFLGTSLYLAPERARGEPYGFASDVWSHGIVSVELAMGRHPFPNMASFLELCDALFRRPEPRLPETFSPDAQSFVAAQLLRAADARLDARTLLQHPFLQCASRQDFVAFLRGLEEPRSEES